MQRGTGHAVYVIAHVLWVHKACSAVYRTWFLGFGACAVHHITCAMHHLAWFSYHRSRAMDHETWSLAQRWCIVDWTIFDISKSGVSSCIEHALRNIKHRAQTMGMPFASYVEAKNMLHFSCFKTCYAHHRKLRKLCLGDRHCRGDDRTGVLNYGQRFLFIDFDVRTIKHVGWV